ncbi:hypothetical protein LXA43DRAFT_601353 [Ganoderma leucocontextum]|nr:hypothetical protein LXA43DRAFT_601353 [Ganoderma leucocontextum]
MIHDVYVNCLPTFLIPYDHEFEVYTTLKEELFHDYRHRPDYKNLFTEGLRSLTDMPVEKLLHGLEMKDDPLILELCIRRFSGCQYDEGFDFSDTMDLLQRMTGHPRLNCVHGPSSLLRARAAATVAWGCFRCLYWSPYSNPFADISGPSMPASATFVDGMLRFAAVCAAADFIPPIVLRIASWAMSCNALYGINVWRTPLGAPYAPLRGTYEHHNALRNNDEAKRLAKVARAPNRYRCAADGCPIQCMTRGGLLRCGGHCLPSKKPYYCSMECQKRHWYVHRYECKQGISIVDDDGDPNWVDVETYKPAPYQDNDLSDSQVWENDENPEIFVDIPETSWYQKGDFYRIRTKSLSPALLRSYKHLWQLPAKERALKSEELWVFSDALH